MMKMRFKHVPWKKPIFVSRSVKIELTLTTKAVQYIVSMHRWQPWRWLSYVLLAVYVCNCIALLTNVGRWDSYAACRFAFDAWFLIQNNECRQKNEPFTMRDLVYRLGRSSLRNKQSDHSFVFKHTAHMF